MAVCLRVSGRAKVPVRLPTLQHAPPYASSLELRKEAIDCYRVALLFYSLGVEVRLFMRVPLSCTLVNPSLRLLQGTPTAWQGTRHIRKRYHSTVAAFDCRFRLRPRPPQEASSLSPQPC